jgi:hypothetical protein
MIFSEAQIFSVFDYAHNLDTRSILHPVRSADRVRYRAKDPAGKLPVHHGDAWRVLVVMSGKVSACQQGCAGGSEVFGRYVVPVGHGSDIRQPQVFGFFLEDIRPAAGCID